MKEILIQVAAIIVAVVSSGIAIFQVLLFLGFPFAEYSWVVNIKVYYQRK